MDDDARGTYNANSEIKFNTVMLKSSLCDYSEVYIILKRTITVTETEADVASKISR